MLQTSFLDYIFGGCEISLHVAIDFTNSNKDPKESDSLHHIRNFAKNQYEQAIYQVGIILQEYD